MPSGLEFYGSNGKTFSETSYTGNFLGSFNTNGQASGTFTDTRLIGLYLVHMVPQNVSGYGGPDVSLNSTTGVITWNYGGVNTGYGAPPIPNDTIYYGGY